MSFAQNENEELVYSFKLKNGKSIVISHDTLQNLLFYRCSKNEKTELEVVDDLNDTITLFSYSYYLRPGGKQNDGMDRNHFYFENEGVGYEVYSIYSASENRTDIGILISNASTHRIFQDMEGKFSSAKGSLIDFRFNELIPVSDE